MSAIAVLSSRLFKKTHINSYHHIGPTSFYKGSFRELEQITGVEPASSAWEANILTVILYLLDNRVSLKPISPSVLPLSIPENSHFLRTYRTIFCCLLMRIMETDSLCLLKMLASRLRTYNLPSRRSIQLSYRKHMERSVGLEPATLGVLRPLALPLSYDRIFCLSHASANVELSPSVRKPRRAFGGGNRTRTCDLQLMGLTRYRFSIPLYRRRY